MTPTSIATKTHCAVTLSSLLPATVIVDGILLYCDRRTYEDVLVANKEIYSMVRASASSSNPPWPETVLLRSKERKSVSCLAVAPSGAWVVCGYQDGTIYLWSRGNGHNRILKGHQAEVLSMTVSPTSEYLAAGSVDGTIRLWHIACNLSSVVTDLAESCSVLQHDEVAGGQGPRPVHSLSFFPDSNILASAGHDPVVHVWDANRNMCLQSLPHPDKVESVAVAPDGTAIATSTWDGAVRLFSVHENQNETPYSSRVLGKGLPLTSVRFSLDGQFVLGLKGFRLRQWPVRTTSSLSSSSNGEPTCICRSGRRVNRVNSVAVSPQGHRIAYVESEGTIRVSTLANAYYNATITRTIHGHMTAGVSAVFSPCGNYLFSGSTDGTVRIWLV